MLIQIEIDLPQLNFRITFAEVTDNIFHGFEPRIQEHHEATFVLRNVQAAQVQSNPSHNDEQCGYGLVLPNTHTRSMI